jgi:hypothetical protein
VDKLMIAARVLGLLCCGCLFACASPSRNEFVERAPVRPTLVLGAGGADSSTYAFRSDDRLGATSEAYRRVSEDATVFVYDRQQSINGRPNNLYWSVTRTNERLER